MRRLEDDRVATLASDLVSPELPSRPLFSMRRKEAFGVSLLISILLFPSLIWTLRDRTVWPFDQAWYGEVSVDLWFQLTKSLHAWKHLLVRCIPTKPPLIVWIGQFFVVLRRPLGSTESALLLSVLLTQAVTLALLYLVGIRISRETRWVAIAGVLFASGSQLFVGLSHQFFVEPLQTLIVTWVFIVMIQSPSWPRSRILIHLAAAIILAGLVKTTTLTYCMVPFLVAVVVLLGRTDAMNFRQELQLWSSRVLLLISFVFGWLGILWYKHNLVATLQHIRDSTTAPLALNYGYRAPFATKMLDWAKLFRQAFFEPYALWAGIVLVIILALSLVRNHHQPQRKQTLLLILVCVTQIAFVLSLISLNIIVESRFLLPLLPSATILVMLLASVVPWRAANLGIIAVFLIQWVTVNLVASGNETLIHRPSPWLIPMDADSARYDELTRVVAMTSVRDGRYNMVGIELPWFSANSAAFFAAKNRLTTGIRSDYRNFGYAEKNLDMALRRMRDNNPMYVLTLDEPLQPQPPDFLNQTALPVLRRLRQNPQFRLVPFQSRLGILVFQQMPQDALDPVVNTSTSP